MIEPHPLRCETCKHQTYRAYSDGTAGQHCEKGNFIIDINRSISIGRVGCASHSAANTSAENVLEQCETCFLKGKGVCQYHGYPDNTFPRSCRFKVGVDAQFALDNLKGTMIIKGLKRQERER